MAERPIPTKVPPLAWAAIGAVCMATFGWFLTTGGIIAIALYKLHRYHEKEGQR